MDSEGTAVSDRQICNFPDLSFFCLLLAKIPSPCAAAASPQDWPYPVPGEAVHLTVDTAQQKYLHH